MCKPREQRKQQTKGSPDISAVVVYPGHLEKQLGIARGEHYPDT